MESTPPLRANVLRRRNFGAIARSLAFSLIYQRLILQDLDPYLAACPVIDWHHPAITAQALILADDSVEQTVINCFEFVRDQIEHVIDFQRDTMTIKASEVLIQGSSLCFGKSHLLVALLRANGIAAGLCYQRLRWDGADSALSWHGLVAYWLASHGWHRCDPRGNSSLGVNAQCKIGQDDFAFALTHSGEQLFAEIWAQPWPALVTHLERCATVDAYCNYPFDDSAAELTLVA
ncbi:transglutaminase family protein [Chitinibacter fontanus]|uniref:Transglutaminase family protein n=1 Tax=Chitinibacter fontanus TaxID=1737446 RepID=A0A7D5ZE51_9NEIS|nr:transglutaminase family protein [Chitinibacter fontanus]QLI80149.1 transglutaminase family protein [Chitinibacter fontanus]